MRRYLIAGHSHIFSMGAPQGYKGPVDLLPTNDGSGHFVMERWSGGRSPAYWDKVIEASRNRDVVLSFNGNQHHGAFLFAPEPLFDFVDEQTPEILEDAVIVPRRLVAAYLDTSFAQLRALVPRIVTAGSRSVLLISGPPPKSDLDRFSDMIRNTQFAQEFARKRGLDLKRAKISPGPLLLKLWRVCQELLNKVAADTGANFVGVPAEAVDDKGFLAKEYYDYVPSDITHGNHKFGQLMLKHALQAVAR